MDSSAEVMRSMPDSGLLTALFQTIDARCWDDLPRYFDPDVVYERPGYATIVGLEQLIAFYRFERAMVRGVHSIEGIVVDGPHAACWGVFTGVLKSGDPVEERFADVYTFEGRAIRARRSHFFRPAC